MNLAPVDTSAPTGGSNGKKAPPPPTFPHPEISATATAQSTHQMIMAALILTGFVFVMVEVAGIGPNAGRLVVTFFIGLILMQGIGHVNPFVTWVNNHPLTRTQALAKTQTGS